MIDLLSIGEAMAELRKPKGEEFGVSYAGDSFNTAIYCKRQLGNAGKVAYLTKVGQDPLSEEFVSAAQAEELDTSHIARDADRNIGIYAVATDEHGERTFSYWRSQSAARSLFASDGELDTLPDARITYLSGISLAILAPETRQALLDKLRSLSASGSTLIAFDSNYRPKLWENAQTARETISAMWQIADIGFPSIDDEMALFGDDSEAAVLNRFRAKKWTACAIKRGSRGPLAVNLADGELPVFEPAQKVVDTTSAGDSFNGGYLAAWLRGEDEKNCLLAGHNLASKVVGFPGAIAPRDA